MQIHITYYNCVLIFQIYFLFCALPSLENIFFQIRKFAGKLQQQMARVSAVACVRMYLNTDKCRIPRNDFRDAGTGDFTALKCSNLKVSKISRVFYR